MKSNEGAMELRLLQALKCMCYTHEKTTQDRLPTETTRFTAITEMTTKQEEIAPRRPTQSIPSPVAALWIVLSITLGLAACTPSDWDAAQEPSVDTLGTIAEVISTTDRFSTLAIALDSTGLAQSLQATGSYTLFAPTNAAFDRLPEGTLRDLLQPELRERLTTILAHHIVEESKTKTALQSVSSLPTLKGHRLPISTNGNTIRVGEAAVSESTIDARNGMIYPIDAVLKPPTDAESM